MQGKFVLNELHGMTDPEKNIQEKYLLNELHRKTDREKKYARKIPVERTTQKDRSREEICNENSC